MKKILISAFLLTALCGLFAQSLFINEVMAKNETTIADPQGDFCDWVEIYNGGDSDIDMGGLYFADDHYDGTLGSAYMIPTTNSEATTVPAGGYLLFWFDEDTADGETHINTKLGGDSDAVYLLNADNEVIDSFEYEYDAETGLDVDDVSIGRVPDGTNGWSFFGSDYMYMPNPGTTNNLIANNEQSVPDIAAISMTNFPNPFNPETTVSFNVPEEMNASVTVYNIRGQKIATLFNGRAEAGANSVVWNGTDESGKKVSSGIYFYKLTAGNQTQLKKMVMVK